MFYFSFYVVSFIPSSSAIVDELDDPTVLEGVVPVRVFPVERRPNQRSDVVARPEALEVEER